MTLEELIRESYVWLIIATIVGIVLLARNFGKEIKFRRAKKDDVEKKPTSDHPSGDHKKHDDHGHGHKKSLAETIVDLSVALAFAALAVLVIFVIVKAVQDSDEETRARMLPSGSTRNAAAVHEAWDPIPPPPETIDCRGLNTPAVVLEVGHPDEPGVSVVVATRPGTVFSSEPDTDEGTITECDYFNPNVCSTPERALSIRTSAFRVTNISNQPVEYFCVHRPMD